MTLIDNDRLNQAGSHNDNGTWLVVMDVENITISINKAGFNLSFKTIDDWVHENFPYYEKAAYLDITRGTGSRNSLHQRGWTLYDVIAKCENENKSSNIIYRNAVDLKLALDTLEAAYLKNPLGILLLGGDGDYIHLVRKLKNHGTYVQVAAVKGAFSKGLKRQADDFFYLDDLVTQREKEKNGGKQLDGSRLIDQNTLEKIRYITIKMLEEREGSIPVPVVLGELWKNTTANCLRDLGIEKSKDLKLKFPDLFKGIEIRENLLTMEDST